MSDVIFPQSAAPLPAKPDNSIPLKWGLISGILSCIITVVSFKVVLGRSYAGFITLSFAGLVVALVMAGLAAAEQRRAQGGFITFREAFRPVFITLLISVVIGIVFSTVYVRYIDPSAPDRVKDATVTAMASMNVPQEKLDEMTEKMDREMNAGNSPGRLALQFAQSLVVASLFGLIPAAIVQKKRRVQNA